jgi:hypothetical protein
LRDYHGRHRGRERGFHQKNTGPYGLRFKPGRIGPNDSHCRAYGSDASIPRRYPPRRIRLRFREPGARPIQSVTVNGEPWSHFNGEWVDLPGDTGVATLIVRFGSV